MFKRILLWPLRYLRKMIREFNPRIEGGSVTHNLLLLLSVGMGFATTYLLVTELGNIVTLLLAWLFGAATNSDEPFGPTTRTLFPSYLESASFGVLVASIVNLTIFWS